MDDAKEAGFAGDDGSVLRVAGLPLLHYAIALLFAVAGVWCLVLAARRGWGFGLVFSVVWLAGLGGWLITSAHDVVMFANGDMRFGMLWGRRHINAADVKTVRFSRGEINQVVVRASGPAVVMGDSEE